MLAGARRYALNAMQCSLVQWNHHPSQADGWNMELSRQNKWYEHIYAYNLWKLISFSLNACCWALLLFCVSNFSSLLFILPELIRARCVPRTTCTHYHATTASRSISKTATDQLISNLSQQNLLQAEKIFRNKYYGDVNCRTKCHRELRLLDFLFSSAMPWLNLRFSLILYSSSSSWFISFCHPKCSVHSVID